MVKHTQTSPPQIADELFECVRPFFGVGAERIKKDVINECYFLTDHIFCSAIFKVLRPSSEIIFTLISYFVLTNRGKRSEVFEK